MNRILKFATIAWALLACFHARAVDRITASVTLTNAAGTTNGQTFDVNGSVRTWTNNVVLSTSQVLTNYARETAKTNLYKHIGLSPFAQVNLVDGNSTNFTLVGNAGVVVTVTPSAGWAIVTYSTQTVSVGTAVRVPYTMEAAAVQTNIASGIVAAVDANASTNVIRATAPAVSATLVGISNAQTIIGIKEFKNGIRGTVQTLTNGTYVSPTFTNAVNYGNAFRSPGSASLSEQFGSSASASGVSSSAFGNAATASDDGATAIGQGAVASVDAATAIGLLSTASGDSATAAGAGATASAINSTAIGSGATAAHATATAIGNTATTTVANQVRLGTGSEFVSIPGGLQVEGAITNSHWNGTNQFQADSDIAFVKKAVTTLANGINQDIVVGTNVFIQVSGPSGAFAIEGIAGGRDGKYVIILNKTGQDMTIACEGGATGNDPTAANRIITMTGADRATTGNGAATLIYSASESRWQLISFDP